MITFATTASLLWVGGFYAAESDVTLNYQARFTLTAGSFTTQSVENWSFGPTPWVGGLFVGYDYSPSFPDSFSLTVPWGTFLGEVFLSLTDLSSFTGLNVVLDSSSMELTNASLTTTSGDLCRLSRSSLGDPAPPPQAGGGTSAHFTDISWAWAIRRSPFLVPHQRPQEFLSRSRRQAGAAGRTRTGTTVRSTDFKSGVSTIPPRRHPRGEDLQQAAGLSMLICHHLPSTAATVRPPGSPARTSFLPTEAWGKSASRQGDMTAVSERMA